MEEEPRLNPFGEVLMRIMSAHGVNSPEELAELLHERTGSDYSAEEIRMWMGSDPEFLHIVDDW